MTAASLRGSVLVVGSGLIGTSIGLALTRSGTVVHLSDTDPATAALAGSLGAGRADYPPAEPGLVVIAVPPDRLGEEIAKATAAHPGAAVTDVGSVKQRPLADAAAAGADVARYVGGHPMAGSERSGPLAASADLFVGRAWAVTAHPAAGPAVADQVVALAAACGATAVPMSPAEHDRAVARVSHLPHLLAVLAAARLPGAAATHLALAGQGLRDVTRVAAGDPSLWTQILQANAEAMADLLRDVRRDLDRALAGLTAPDPGLGDLLIRGAAGTAAIPGKHGEPVRREASVFVWVPDRPGELARLLTEVGDEGVNLEDLRIDHTPGRPAGVVEVVVQPDAVPRLEAALATRGWTVHR